MTSLNSSDLRLERLAQHRHGVDQPHDAGIGRELERRRIDVVGALAHVDVFVGVQEFVVALAAGRAVPARGWRSPRWRSCWSRCRRRPGSRRPRTARAACRPGSPRQAATMASARVASSRPSSRLLLRRRQLDRGQRRDQVRIDRDRGAGDRKILDRAQRVDAVIGVRRHIAVAQQIVFASRGHRKTLSPGCFANPDEIRKGRLFQALLLTIAGSPQTGAIRHASGGPAPRGPSQFAEAT